jgi:pSer/pThr/pTyr-binding forkhead associated (FHA) protein
VEHGPAPPALSAASATTARTARTSRCACALNPATSIRRIGTPPAEGCATPLGDPRKLSFANRRRQPRRADRLDTFEQTCSTYSSCRPDGPQRREASQLFLVVECDRPWAGSSRHILESVDEVVIGRGTHRTIERLVDSGVRRLLLRVPDPRLSSIHARIRREGAFYFFEDAHSKNGSIVNGRPCHQIPLKDGDLIECGRTFFRFRIQPIAGDIDLDAPDLESSQVAPGQMGFSTLIPSLAAQFREIHQLARSARRYLSPVKPERGRSWSPGRRTICPVVQAPSLR